MPVRMKNRGLERTPLKEAMRAKSSRRRQVLKEAANIEALTAASRNDLLPELRLVEIPINELKMPKRRTRKLELHNIDETTAAIRALGFSVPPLIGPDNEVIDGEARIIAARQSGLTSLPCVVVPHLDAMEQRALRQAVNNVGRNRLFDLDALRDEFLELQEASQPIRSLGLSGVELDQILRLQPVRETVPDAPDADAVAITRPGDVWLLGRHRLLCGDAKIADSYSRLLEEQRARLVLTDPPYKVAIHKVIKTRHRDFVEGGGDTTDEAFIALIAGFLGHSHERLVEGGIVLSFMDWKNIATVITLGEAAGFELINLIAWVKPQAGMGSLWRSQHELIAALKKPGKHCNNIQLGKNGRDRSNVWMVPGAGTMGTDARKMLANHPTPKPVDMLVDAILDVSDRDDIVLDPFGGSGSTLIACEQSGRIARMIEKDPLYCDLIIRRWEEETGGFATLAESGDRFIALAEHRTASPQEVEVRRERL